MGRIIKRQNCGLRVCPTLKDEVGAGGLVILCNVGAHVNRVCSNEATEIEWVILFTNA